MKPPLAEDAVWAVVTDAAVGASRALVGTRVRVCARGQNRYHCDVVLPPAAEGERARTVTLPTSWLAIE